MFYKISLFVLLVLYMINKGNTLKCYICDSLTTNPNDVNCLDKPAPNVGTTACTAEVLNRTLPWLEDYLKKQGSTFPDENSAWVCSKIVREGEKKSVFRACNLAKTDKYDYCTELLKYDPVGKLTSCEFCTTDGCNVGSDLAPSAKIILLILMAVCAACWSIV